MKTILATLLVVASSAAMANSDVSAEDMKKMALEACEANVANIPAEQKEMVLKTCKCTVEKTDYAEVLKASQSGDVDAVTKKAQEAALECAKANQ